MPQKNINDKIEFLRLKLYRLYRKEKDFSKNTVIKLSQKLDDMLNKKYRNCYD